MYRVINREDQREDIFRRNEDRQEFSAMPHELCGRTGLQVRAQSEDRLLMG